MVSSGSQAGESGVGGKPGNEQSQFAAAGGSPAMQPMYPFHSVAQLV